MFLARDNVVLHILWSDFWQLHPFAPSDFWQYVCLFINSPLSRLHHFLQLLRNTFCCLIAYTFKDTSAPFNLYVIELFKHVF